MDRSEFLDVLGRSLKGKVDDNEYASQMEYYTSYFQDEIASGRSEQEILEELGDPRLIAKTIVSAYGFQDDKIGRAYMNDTVSEDGKSYDDNGGIHETRRSVFGRFKFYAIIVLVILFFILMMAVMFRVFAYMMPIIFVLIAVSFILAMFRRR